VPLTPAELEPLLRIALVEGVGAHRLARLIERFGSAEAVLAARPVELRGLRGIGEELAGRIRAGGGGSSREEARRATRTLAGLGAQALVPGDPAYPRAFAGLPDPPYLLFAAGDLELLQAPAVAIVGTRAPTSYGRRAALELGRDLAWAGFTVVSGMARGIDTAAHRGALEGAGGTIGVLGHGIEQVYPPENRHLFTLVRERGLLLTEYPPGETPKAGNFPRRNRLIVALSEAVLVVEMGHRSGAQHTVGYALEQGREVMAVPGPIASPASAGTNQLIKEGARLVATAEDVIEELRGVGAARGATSGARRPAPGAAAAARTTPLQERLLAALSRSPAHVDEVAADAEVSVPSALGGLLELELRGLVAALPGQRFALA
jgi:DNA processing protein